MTRVKLAAIALTNASLSSSLVSSPLFDERKAAMVPANESHNQSGQRPYRLDMQARNNLLP